ncbi:Hypothetical predicted protein [Olea europaea subsp. europaea]|uniref:Uncharacterized protein n=1 Tax=Olea europaea subsp. europaea TaxID=158383 RepID=A0A8S0S2T0_OLEEU|nr:Hypothetical predicted protein [Olea europaea subsp. europaea]
MIYDGVPSLPTPPPQKTKKKQRKETRATDSMAEIKDQMTVSTMGKEKSTSGHRTSAANRRGSKLLKLLRLRLLLQLGVKYEANSLGHRKNDVGSEKLTSSHRKADADDPLGIFGDFVCVFGEILGNEQYSTQIDRKEWRPEGSRVFWAGF